MEPITKTNKHIQEERGIKRSRCTAPFLRRKVLYETTKEAVCFALMRSAHKRQEEEGIKRLRGETVGVSSFRVAMHIRPQMLLEDKY